MRILRLRLKDWRGVDEVELDFPRTGVTVVEGPNEVGKSSLVEALAVLFDEYDSTAKKGVKAVQPVGRDVGPEVEIEATTGPYAFRYRKRFLRRPETELDVSVPAPERLTGREAHDRAQEILRETVDTDLWEQLKMLQGGPVVQARLTHARDLAKALDARSGVETAGERETSLFDRVYTEYGRWFTPKGRPRFEGVLEAEREAAARVEALEADLAALESDIARSEVLEGDIAQLGRRVVEDAEAARRRRAEWEQLKERRAQVGLLEMQWRTAAAQESAARREERDRRTLGERLAAAERRREELEARVAQRRPVLERAEADWQEARAALESAEHTHTAARAAFDLRDRDMKFRDAELQLQQLDERRARIEKALAEAADAAAFLEANRVTPELLEGLERSHEALVRAAARLEAGSPRVELRAETGIEAEWDGEPARLVAGESLERAVSERTTLRVPGALEVTVRAGTSLEALAKARDGAQREFAELLERARVPGLEQARDALRRAEQAGRLVEDGDARVKENLRDLTLEQLDEKRARLRARVEQYPSERPDGPPMATDFESAAKAKGDAQVEVEAAEQALREARARIAERERVFQELRHESHGTSVELRLAGEAEQAARRDREEARARKDDEELALAVRKASENARESEQRYVAEKRALEQAHPERVEDLARNAEQAAERTAERLRDAREELAGLRSRLEVRGEGGLFDAVEDAKARHAAAERERRATERRARAAALLCETMQAERERARTAYAGPLREQIEGLARYVFDDGVRVDLNEDLSIATVIRDGTPLSFESLSVGTQEQLALIQRVAVAMLIAGDGGVPLLFDDTLGHSDPQRLEGMGAMLAHAGDHCQVIVLTCTPDRFRWASSISLRETRKS